LGGGGGGGHGSSNCARGPPFHPTPRRPPFPAPSPSHPPPLPPRRQAQLDSWSRWLASTFFARPPESSLGEALQHFERAEALRPGFWLANQLWLGRAHAALGDGAAAARWLHAAGSMPVRSDEDADSAEAAAADLAALRGVNWAALDPAGAEKFAARVKAKVLRHRALHCGEGALAAALAALGAVDPAAAAEVAAARRSEQRAPPLL
jgi:hypothetical protein